MWLGPSGSSSSFPSLPLLFLSNPFHLMSESCPAEFSCFQLFFSYFDQSGLRYFSFLIWRHGSCLPELYINSVESAQMCKAKFGSLSIEEYGYLHSFSQRFQVVQRVTRRLITIRTMTRTTNRHPGHPVWSPSDRPGYIYIYI
jgi:hypothetical protein